MKKILLVSFLCFFSLASLEAKKVAGKIIFNDGSTKQVVMDIPENLILKEPNFVALQRKVEYIDADGKTNKVKPEAAQEIQFEYKGTTNRLLSKMVVTNARKSDKQSRRFLKVEQDGKVQLFKYYLQSPTSPAEQVSFTRFALQKEADQAVTVLNAGNQGMKQELKVLFQDTPELISKIEEKSFMPRNDLPELINTINSKPKK